MTAGGVPNELIVRELAPADSVHDLTALLHRAYAPLAAQGLQFLATYQNVATTRKRITGGHCLVADVSGQVVGTITWHPHNYVGGRTEWYERPDVAIFHQLCTEPAFQGRGIASRLLAEAEEQARRGGAAELACDTAQPAQHLIDWYTKRGYRVVGETDWRPTTNYLSVILSKTL